MSNNHYYVIGLMSGTSLDGVDLCYVSFKKSDITKFNIISSKTFSYDKKWLNKLKEGSLLDKIKLKKLDNKFAILLSKFIRKFIQEFKIEKVDFISSHGHTIFHEPQKGKTLQIGNGKIICKKVNINVVSNFRIQDVKYKGQGAPLVPIGDLHLFRDYKFCINLGGFSNISIKNNGTIKAYDICPVNTVLNYYSNKLGYSFDSDGILSKKGSINLKLLSELNKISFYEKTGPKSLGIEFVKSEIFPIIDKYLLNPEDILKTFIEHISDQINRCIINGKNEKILLTGGGSYNKTLVEAMKNKLDSNLIIPKNEIVDFKEALIFAYIGLLRIKKKINCLKSVTGANKDHSSGDIYKI